MNKRGKKFTDKDILQGLIDENNEALSYIYKHYYPSVQWMVLQNGGAEEDARDLFQEAVLVLHQKLREGDFNLWCSVKTYLYSVSKYLWLKELTRRKKLILTEVGDEQYLFLYENEESEPEKELFEFYFKQFEQLSKECKKILNLHFRNASINEITRKLGYPNNQYTMNRKYRCKQRLIKKLCRHPYFNDHDRR